MEMEEHHQWVNATSCHPHTGSPYSQEEFDDCVSISAIMENFDTDKLVEFVNHVCKTTQQSWLTHHLEASPMQSGIQFQPTCENFTYAIKLESGSTARLYSNYYFDSRGTEESFFKNCKIQITNREPFGATTAQAVQLTACSNVPLRIMLEILQAFWLPANQRHTSLRDFGQIAIVETQGLPDGTYDHLLWCYLPRADKDI